MKKLGIKTILIAVSMCGSATFAQQQSSAYPAHPLRFIVPFPAGGATGNIGLDMLAKAPPATK